MEAYFKGQPDQYETNDQFLSALADDEDTEDSEDAEKEESESGEDSGESGSEAATDFWGLSEPEADDDE